MTHLHNSTSAYTYTDFVEFHRYKTNSFRMKKIIILKIDIKYVIDSFFFSAVYIT